MVFGAMKLYNLVGGFFQKQTVTPKENRILNVLAVRGVAR